MIPSMLKTESQYVLDNVFFIFFSFLISLSYYATFYLIFLDLFRLINLQIIYIFKHD
jgi:hypothetical protein